MNIVLLDDTLEHLDLLAEFVGELRPDAMIYRCQDARRLIEVLDSQPADLVLMDLIMPSMNGLDLVRRVRARWSALPVVAVSGLQQPNHRVTLREAGFTDAIAKPFEMEDLSRVLDHHLPR